MIKTSGLDADVFYLGVLAEVFALAAAFVVSDNARMERMTRSQAARAAGVGAVNFAKPVSFFLK